MAWAHVQSTIQAVASGANAKAFASSVTAGSLLICAVDLEVATATISSVSDSNGNTWLPIGSLVSSNPLGAAQLYYAKNANAGATTVSMTPSTGQSTIIILEYSGLDTSNPLDTNIGQAGGPSATADSGNASTFEANELIVGFTIALRGITAGAGFTDRQNNSHLNFMDVQDKNGSGGSQNVTATLANSSGTWACLLAAFRQPFVPSTGRQLLGLMGIG